MNKSNGPQKKISIISSDTLKPLRRSNYTENACFGLNPSSQNLIKGAFQTSNPSTSKILKPINSSKNRKYNLFQFIMLRFCSCTTGAEKSTD